MSNLIKDLEDGDNEGWYGEFFHVEVYLPEKDRWEQHNSYRFDWRSKAEGYAQYHAYHTGKRMRLVMVREIHQPIAGAVFEPGGPNPD